MADENYDDPYFDSFDDAVEPTDLEGLVDPEDAPAAPALLDAGATRAQASAETTASPSASTGSSTGSASAFAGAGADSVSAARPSADHDHGSDDASDGGDGTGLDPALMAALADAISPAVQDARRSGNLPAHKWDAANYAGSNNDGSAADKLADSAVAPLVAAARGYETVHEDNLEEATKRLNLPRKNSSQGKRIANSVTRGDLLIMPWFTSADLAVAARRVKDPLPTTIQYRPSRPDLHPKTGKEMKYEFVASSKTPVAVHPAFSQDWIDNAPVVLLAEGLLKGDSALTGYLLDAGVPVSDLAWYGGGTAAARKRLAEILDSIPVEKRIVIFTIGGVDNWKNNAEWRDLELARRDVWVGIDGDVSSNPHVYRAANELWDFLTTKKKANVSLIAPTVQVSEGEKKIGIDDYLSHHGTWQGLLGMLAPKLPAPPQTDNLRRIGEFRVSDDGTCLEVCTPKADPYNPDGPPVDGKWDFEYGLGGRILSTVAQRVPTPQEIKSGILGDGANNDEAEAYCEVEISWREGEDKVHRHVVSGPAEILNYPPDQWVRHKAHIPAAVLRNPEWPPPRKLAEEWLRAVKGHKADEILDRVRWDSMGWVPVEGSVPAFVVGDQVIGDEDSADVDIFPGITEAELAGANRFGVGEKMLGSFDDDDYQAQVRSDIEEVIETFILGGAWTDRKVASTIVAAALRPTLPIRPHSTLFLVGPPSKGKALALDARIPVPVSEKFPTGWALNRDLSVGDEVYAADGTVTRILFLSDVIDDMDMYRFTLADGQTITSTASHLWKVSTKQSRSTYQRNRHAAGRAARQTEANRLRALAAEFSNGDGVTLKNMSETFGVPYSTIHAVTTRYGIQSETFYGAYGNEATGSVDTTSIHKVRLFPVGETLLALANHIENGRGTVMPVERVMTSAEVAALPRTHAPAIHLGGAITGTNVGDDVTLPVAPYTLGAWLGDGTTREASLTCFDQQILDRITADGYTTTAWKQDGHYTVHGIVAGLREAGLVDNKHIPASYLRASAAQRLALLQGLMDTDGTVSGTQAQCEFTSVSRTLAEGVLELVRSLGIKATRTTGPATITETDPVTGEKTRRTVGERHRVRFTTNQPVFGLDRKAERLRGEVSNEVSRLGILDVERLDPVASRCIQVEHETGMFLADGFVPTHNSWTAGLMMGFWSRRPGTFTSSSLPGSAKDTAASIETAVARAPIWVVDDLAPASSRQQSEQEQNKIGDLIRNVFNGAGKRRSTADMGSRKVHTPRSLLVVTAENEPQVASVRDRCITINIGWGALAKSSDPTDLVQELCQDKGSPARLTQAMIRYLRYWAKTLPDGWRDLYKQTEDYLVTAQDRAAAHMRERGAKSGDVKRHADLAGDVAVSLFVLRRMAEHVGVRDEIMDLISTTGMIGDIYDLVVTGHKAGKESTPGRSLIAAIQSALFKGAAHVIDPVDASSVPGGPNLGPMLGWQVSASGDSRPRGNTIGWLVTDKDDGEQYVYLDQRTAFSIAQKEHPDLVPPGQGARSSWGSVIGEKLASEHLLRPKGDGTRLNTARRRVGDADISGVPIRLAVLLASGNPEDAERRNVDDQ